MQRGKNRSSSKRLLTRKKTKTENVAKDDAITLQHSEILSICCRSIFCDICCFLSASLLMSSEGFLNC